jgi:hypothetical protein
MSDAAKITREDRLAAYQAARGIAEPPLGSRARQWVDAGGDGYRDWERIAQAMADVRAATAIAVTKDVLDLYRKDLNIGWEYIERDLAKISAKYGLEKKKEDTNG